MYSAVSEQLLIGISALFKTLTHWDFFNKYYQQTGRQMSREHPQPYIYLRVINMCLTYCKRNKVYSCSTKGCTGGTGVQWYVCLLWVLGWLYSSAQETSSTCWGGAFFAAWSSAAALGNSCSGCKVKAGVWTTRQWRPFRSWGVSQSGLFLSHPQPSVRSVLSNTEPACRNRSAACSRAMAGLCRQMAGDSLCWLSVQDQAQHWVIGSRPPSSDWSQMDASWMLNDST